MNYKGLLVTLICLTFLTSAAPPYPIDGYALTGIKRLHRLELIISGDLKETMPIKGAMKSIADIKLNLMNQKGDSLCEIPGTDPALQKSINALFPSLNEKYSISVLDITPGKKLRYASRKETVGYQPGSVGKIAVAAGFLTELQKIYPESFAKRQELMRTKNVRAGKWAMTDSHTVPFFDLQTNVLVKRTVQEKDVFSLYEWLDHMMSVSNNGAASVCWREAVLMRAFGKDYPTLTQEQADLFFKNTPKSDLTTMANAIVNEPLRKLGISDTEWKLGRFFTAGGESFIPPRDGSIGTTVGLMKFLIAMEKGQVVDPQSSLEIKRLMYMTDRRIRYASAASLKEAAVYFKSGSLYKCKEEEGYTCEQYKGNVDNFMNSIAIVEHPDGSTYMVAMMSNVLKKNSGSDHMALASSIDKAIRK